MSYRVSDKDILHNGNLVQLFGVNWIGLEQPTAILHGIWSEKPRDVLQQIIGAKFNCIRLPIGPATLRGVEVPANMSASDWLNTDLRGLNSLQLLDYMVNLMESMGLRYVFDMHYLDKDGKLPDLWYSPDYSESAWLEDITKLAARYNRRPGFVAIDLKNEPNANSANWGSGDPKTDWKMAVEKAYNAINAVNQDILICYEALGISPGVSELTKNPPAIPAERQLVSIHVYGPSVWGPYTKDFEALKASRTVDFSALHENRLHSVFAPVAKKLKGLKGKSVNQSELRAEPLKASNFPANMPAIWDKYFGNVSKNNCVYIGEFGGKYTEKDKIWHDAFVDYLGKKGVVNVAFWGWTNSSGWDTGGLLTDDGGKTIDAGKLSMLQRLWTPAATLTTQPPSPRPIPSPGPRPEPVNEPTPAPVNEPVNEPADESVLEIIKFPIGSLVELISGSPVMAVCGYDSATGSYSVSYYNSVTGAIEAFDVVPETVLQHVDVEGFKQQVIGPTTKS